MTATRSVEAAMTADRTMSPRSAPSLGGQAKRGRAFLSGALGAALVAAALAFPAGEAQARDECGALASGEATCTNTAYASGIRYDAADGWGNGIAGDVGLTVTGGAATTITSPTANGFGSGIVVRTAQQGTGVTTSRTIALTVGSGTNAVVIAQGTGTGTDGFNHSGIVIHQRGVRADATTVTLGSGVDIGTMTAPMKRSGVHVLVESNLNTADHSITSAADIYSSAFGLLMDARGSGSTTVRNTGSIFNVAATNGVTGQADGIRILDWSGRSGRGGNERPATATTTVDNSGSISVSQANGIGINVDAEGFGLYKTVNSGTVSATATAAHGIFVNALRHWGAAGTKAVEIENSGSITTASTSAFGIFVTSVDNAAPQGRGDGNLEITNSGAISSANTAILVNSNMGDTTVTHSGGSITAAGAHASGIRVQQGGTGAVTVESGADVTAENHGILVLSNPTPDATTVTVTVAAGETTRTNQPMVSVADGNTTTTYDTRGDTTVKHTGGEITSSAESGIWVQQAGADATVESGADVTAKKYGIFVTNNPALATRLVVIAAGSTTITDTWSTTGAVSVTHSAGTISAETEAGIHAQNSAGNADAVTVAVSGGSVTTEGQSKAAVVALQLGTGDAVANVTGGTLTSKHNAGVYADLGHADNTAGQVKVTQGGTIAARNGVYARVGRASATGETREAMKQPVIAVTWTGSFSHGTTATVAPTDAERFLARDVAHAVAVAQEVEAEKAMRPDDGSGGHLRYGSRAGVEAQVMSWREVMTAVAKGDDPGAFADAAAVTALFADNADTAAVAAAFRAVLANADLDDVPGAAAIDSDGTTGLSDGEIIAYLSVDDAARRDLLRNVLAQSFTEEERAVLRAVATNTGLEAALGAEDADFSDAYKTAVRGLLDRYNVGDIEVAMDGGSIDSGGDGIRAYYATPHDGNGAIEVTIAAGTTVIGGMAGVYVANAGTDDDGVRKQSVRVDGTVRGGSDAAVHLVGGGRLTLGERGEVLAGASGLGVLVNDPGPAHLVIGGLVRGGAGADAAVDLTGGGTVTVGATGRVEAGGAARAIRASSGTTVVIAGMVKGSSGGEAAVDLSGGGTMTVGATGRVEADGAANAIRSSGAVVIAGMVKGSNGGEAAVRLSGGGEVTIRPVSESGAARVDANGARWAIQGVGSGAQVVIETRGSIRYQDDIDTAAEESVKGRYDGVEEVVVAQVDDQGRRTGHYGVPLKSDGTLDTGKLVGVPSRAEEARRAAELRRLEAEKRRLEEELENRPELAPEPETKPEQQPEPQRPAAREFRCEGQSRCELYEALPAVLLAMNGMPSYAERTSALRDANGGWARVEAFRGKWRARKAKTAEKLSFDHRRGGVRAGLDFMVGEQVRGGVSGHLFRGKAETTGVGDVEVDGVGAGASATWRRGELYVDVQAVATWYEVDVSSAEFGKVVKGAEGMGYAMGVEAGRGMELGGLVVTPRAGFVQSQVGMDDFTDTVGPDGAWVSVEEADSARGRLGVLVETEVEWGERAGRLFGSLDVEREFSDETQVYAGASASSLKDNDLKTEVHPTTMRLGVGGVLGVGDDLVLRATAGYERTGRGTSSYGGGLELNLRF